MCGIVGTYYFDRTRPVDPKRLSAQAETIAHRGPNDGGLWVGPGVGLAHRRLSIIDLGGGHQPMFDPRGRFAIVFNGEIYNYRELREELIRRGRRFRTDSDTEVIVEAHAEWGEQAVERFNGMFAYGLYDRREHQLVLARDRLGKKPLYVYRDADRIVFASELKAIVADPTIPREIEPTAVADYFALAYVPAPKTIYQRIEKLPAASIVTVKGEHFAPRAYWDVSFADPDEGTSLETHAERLLELLEDAVRIRLRADVPIGAFLSGGVDSSATVGVMARLLDRPVVTNSIGFDVSRFDEREYARAIAERFHTEHHEEVLVAEAGEVVEALSHYYDEPFADSSAVPTYYLCGMTKNQVTVALSGDGGDELFAGYHHYAGTRYAASIRARVPGLMQKAAAFALPGLLEVTRYSSQAHGYGLLAERVLTDADRATYLGHISQPGRWRELLGPGFLDGLGDYDPFDQLRPLYDRSGSKDVTSRAQYVDLKTYLCDDILVKVDRASMAHALEVRCPLLDYRIVEYAARIPVRFKAEKSKTKFVLLKAIEPFLPPSLFDRKKQGFAIPIGQWHRTALKPITQALCLDRPGGHSGLLAKAGLRRVWHEHQSGLVDHGFPLWNAMTFELYWRRWMDRSAPAVTPTPSTAKAAPIVISPTPAALDG